MINNKFLIWISLLCIMCLFVLYQNKYNIHKGGSIDDASKRKIKNIKKSLEEDLKHSEYNTNKYNYKMNIEHLIEKNLDKITYFQTYNDFLTIFNEYKGNLKSNLSDDKKKINMIVKLVNNRYYNLVKHIIVKLFLHILEIDSSSTFKYSGGNINTIHDILNHREFYKYYFNLDDNKIKSLTNSKYSYNQLIVMNSNDININKNNILEYPSCWGEKPTFTIELDKWEKINKFIDQVCLYLNKYIDVNSNITLINEIMYSLELIKRTLNNETDNKNKFINISKLFLKHIINYSNSNTFSIMDILKNNENILEDDIQNILKLKNNKDLIKNIIDYIDISFNKEKIRDSIKLPNNIIPTRLPKNIDKFETFIKYNKIYTKIILNDNDLNLETTIKNFLKQNDYIYDITSNISNTILDNIFKKIKQRISSNEEPVLYQYLHFICKNNFNLNYDYSEELSIINDNPNTYDKKQLIFKIVKETSKNDIKVTLDETFDLITNLIKSKYHKLTKNNKSFNIDILTKRTLNDLFYKNIDANSEVNVYSIKNSTNKYTTYKTNHDSLKYKIKIIKNISNPNDPDNKKIEIIWTRDGHTTFPSKNIDYFYIDNVLFFINSIEHTSSLYKTSTPINYIYFEENLIEYLERSSLDNHYLTKEKFNNSPNVDTISIKQAQNYQNYTSAPISLLPDIDTYKTESINALDNIYKGGSNNKENNYLIDNMFKRLAVYDKVNKKYKIPSTEFPLTIGEYTISESYSQNNEKLTLTVPADLQDKFNNIKEKITDFSIFDKESSFINNIHEQPNFYNENYEILDKGYNHKIKHNEKYNDGTYLITGLEKNIDNNYDFYVTNIYKIIDKSLIEEQIKIITTKSALVNQNNSIINNTVTDDILEKLELNNKKVLNNVTLDYYNIKLDTYKNNALNFITNNNTNISFQNNQLDFNNILKKISIKHITNKLEKFNNEQISTLDIKNNFIILLNDDFKKYYKQTVYKNIRSFTTTPSSDTIITERWPDLEININVNNKLLNLEYIKKKIIDIIIHKIISELLKITNAVDTDKYTKWFNKIRLEINILFKHIENLQICLYKSLSQMNPTYFNFHEFKQQLKSKNIVFNFNYEQNFVNKFINNLSLNNINELSEGLLNSLLFDTKKIIEDIDSINRDKNKFTELTGSINLTDNDIISILSVPNTPVSDIVPTGSSSSSQINNFREKLSNFVKLEYENTGSNSPFFCVQLKDTTGNITDTWTLIDLPSQNTQRGGFQNLKSYCTKKDCNKYTNEYEFLDLLSINRGALATRNQIKLQTTIILNINIDEWQMHKKLLLNDLANKIGINAQDILILNVINLNNTPSAIQRGGNYILGGNSNVSIDFEIQYLFESNIEKIIYNLNKIKNLINNDIPIFIGKYQITNLNDYKFIKHDKIIERNTNIILEQSEDIQDINIKDILLTLVDIYETVNFDKMGIPWSKKHLEKSDENLEIDNSEIKKFYYILNYYLPNFLNNNIDNQIWNGKTHVKIIDYKIVKNTLISDNNASDMTIKLLEIYGIICNIRFNLFNIIDNMLNYNFKISHSKWVDKTNIMKYPNDDDKKLPNQNSKLEWKMYSDSNCILLNLETDPDYNNQIIDEHKTFYEEHINNKFKDYNIKLKNYEKDKSKIVIKYYDILNNNFEKIVNNQILDLIKIKNDLKTFGFIPVNKNIYISKPKVYLKNILKKIVDIDFSFDLTHPSSGSKIKDLSHPYIQAHNKNAIKSDNDTYIYYKHLRKFFWNLKLLFPQLSVNVNNFISKPKIDITSDKIVKWKINSNSFEIEPNSTDIYSKQTIDLLYIIGIIIELRYELIKIIQEKLNNSWEYTTNFNTNTRGLSYFAKGIANNVKFHFISYRQDAGTDVWIVESANNNISIQKNLNSLVNTDADFKTHYQDKLVGFTINKEPGKFRTMDVEKIKYSDFMDNNYEKIKKKLNNFRELFSGNLHPFKKYGLISENVEIII